MKDAIDQYFSRYAEKEIEEIGELNDIYEYVIVIPICNEEYNCLDTIFSVLDKSLSVLVVLVVNSPEGITNQKYHYKNNKYISNLEEKSNLNYVFSRSCKLLKFINGFDVFLVDRNSIGFQLNEKQGVGLARKIGCDIALKLFHLSKIKTPWIFSTDADVILPENYFNFVHQYKYEYSAIVLDFEHFSENDSINKVQYLYDLKLRYYHAGIVSAGSDYDYIPLGSTLIASMQCYSQVRGFPKKNAGEDFYLLNKLAKIKPIAYNNHNPKIKIKSRYSDRVPFGTGPAIMKINALENTNNYLFYHPECFELLKQWIEFLKNMWTGNQLLINQPESSELLGLYHSLNCQIVFEKSRNQITSRVRWQQFIHQWFDAFKTLKAVHYFDQSVSRINIKQLLKSKGFDKVKNHSLQKFIQRNDKT